jgi:uncharacterized membrane protein
MGLSRRVFLSGLVGAAIGAALGVAPTNEAQAHPGALNAAGCHRVRRTGAYHCHAGRALRGQRRRFVTWGGSNAKFSSRYRRRRARRRR